MRIKTFYAKTMAEAMQEIKAALGADALLLSTKEIPSRSGVGALASGFEVVAACDDAAPESGPEFRPPLLVSDGESNLRGYECDQSAENTGDAASITYSPVHLRRPVARLAHDLAAGHRAPLKKRFRVTAPPSSASSGAPFADAPSSGLYHDLLASGVEEWLARKLLLEARGLIGPQLKLSRAALLQAAGCATQALVPACESSNGDPRRRIVAFVGPTGVGKTTTMAKLAARLTLQQKKRVVLMTLDSFRIGAVEQLRSYASLMGIPFRFVNRVADLPKAVREQSQRDYILIDTAGRSPRDAAAVRDLAGYLETLEQTECHLVLSATTKPADMHEIVDRFEACKPDCLLFTKLDETSTLGPLLNEMVRTRKRISYYSDGQRVPEDLHTVPTERMIDIVLHKN